MNKYYVYCHCFQDTNEIFYIGKGTGRRLVSPCRTDLWKSLTETREYYSMKIRENLLENEAIDFEHELLQEFKPVGNVSHKSHRVKKIEYAVVKEIVEYDETSPTFLRYKSRRANGRMKPGDIAGSFDSEGYGQIYIKDRLYKIHRVIYCLFLKDDLDSNLLIDHIDRNKSNNNISNLRLTNHSGNAKNIDWNKVKPTNTGERAISLKGNTYRVLWMGQTRQQEKPFTFGPRTKMTQEEALSAAIAFRDSLVSGGFIEIG